MSKKQNQIVEIVNNGNEVTLEDFVIVAKITAFLGQYAPATHWSEDCDTFTDYQLRSFFKAVVTPYGDPLNLYIQELERHGFVMRNDECGEPVLYALPKL